MDGGYEERREGAGGVYYDTVKEWKGKIQVGDPTRME